MNSCVALLSVLCVLVAMRVGVMGPQFKIDAIPFKLSGEELPQLKQNNRLAQVEKVFQGELTAPEHYAFKDDWIYISRHTHEHTPNRVQTCPRSSALPTLTNFFFAPSCCPGLHDGRIVRTQSDASGSLSPLELVVYTGNPALADRDHPCGSPASEAVCGRPLGMAFDKRGKLIVADCYLGLIEVDVDAKTRTILIDQINGTPIYFTNSVVVGPNSGRIYFTDSTSRWRRREFIYEVMEGKPTGRVISYDPTTKATRVIADQIAFANGILVDPTESYLLVSELNRAQILRFDIREESLVDEPVHWDSRRDQDDERASVLIDNLPGINDNLSWAAPDADGALTLWIGCGTKRSRPFSTTDALSSHPMLRNILTWLVPQPLLLRVVPHIGLVLRVRVSNKKTLFNPKGWTIGTLLETLQDTNGKTIHLITGAYQHKEYLYLGSISDHIHFVPRIKWTDKNNTDTTWRSLV